VNLGGRLPLPHELPERGLRVRVSELGVVQRGLVGVAADELARQACAILDHAHVEAAARDQRTVAAQERYWTEAGQALGRRLVAIAQVAERQATNAPTGPLVSSFAGLADLATGARNEWAWATKVAELLPSTKSPLHLSLRALARFALRHFSIHAVVEVRGSPRAIEEDAEPALYLVAAGALRIAATTGRATEVRVGLAFGERSVTLKVKDNGSDVELRPASGDLSYDQLGRQLEKVGDFHVNRQAYQGVEVVAVVKEGRGRR